MSIVRFFIFRHGETDWNRQGLFQGHTDIPLNDNGKIQALTLVDPIKNFNPEIVISSDLKRAIETATIALAGKDLDWHISSDMREINIGDYEGLHRDIVKSKLGEQGWKSWEDPDHINSDFKFPNGESKKEVFSRVLGLLEKFANESSHTRIAVSTHGGVIKRLAHGLTILEQNQVPIKNCCLYEIQYNKKAGQWKYIGLLN